MFYSGQKQIFLLFSYEFSLMQLVTLDFSVKKKAYGIESIHSMITGTLFHFLYNKLEFILQLETIYLVYGSVSFPSYTNAFISVFSSTSA